VTLHISSGKVNTDGKALYACDDPSEFLGDIVFPPPVLDGVENGGTFRAKGDPCKCRQWRF